MSTNHTANYNLCQWEATDQVLRTDFNQDNAKIDAALGDFSITADGVKNLAYMVYDLAMQDYTKTVYHGNRRGLLMDNFTNRNAIDSLSGGVVLQNETLVLSGTGKTGVMTSLNLSTGVSSWSRVIAWVKYDGSSTCSLAINGASLTSTGRWTMHTRDNISCLERQYESNISGNGNAVVTLTLETGTAASATVYEYGVMFF